VQARMLAKAHKSLIKVSCRAEILKHSQSNPSKEVEQALMSHLRECNKVRPLFFKPYSGYNFNQAVRFPGRPRVVHHQISFRDSTQSPRPPHISSSSREAAGLLRRAVWTDVHP
jgi:hypothetical protein